MTDQDYEQELACLLLEGVPEDEARKLAARKSDTLDARRQSFPRSGKWNINPRRRSDKLMLWGFGEHEAFSKAEQGTSLTQLPPSRDLDTVWTLVDLYCTSKQREAIELVYGRDDEPMSFQKSARHLGISQSALENRVYGGIGAIRKAMGVETEREQNRRASSARRRARYQEKQREAKATRVEEDQPADRPDAGR